MTKSWRTGDCDTSYGGPIKNSRLFEILYLLVERRAVTAGELVWQDEIPFALQAILATGSESEGETLARLTALFRREGTDWLEVDFTPLL